VCGLCIGSIGAVGIVAPSILVRVAERFVASGEFEFYVLAAVRIAFGVILISVAPTSRVPKAIRIVGSVIVILGLITALVGLAAIAPAQGAIDSWMHQGVGVLRLTAGLILALGGFIAWACAPTT
jgi:hypothetical protein